MSLMLLIGGARSGKSSLAVKIASAQSRPVVFIATGEPRDEEMAERIARHRAGRPASWTTVEEPLDLEGALRRLNEDDMAVIDCLTLWVSNLMEREADDDAIAAAALRAADVAAARADVLAVTNEVGSGVIPERPLGRRFSDVLGRVNGLWAAAADRTVLVVAGKILELKDAEQLRDG